MGITAAHVVTEFVLAEELAPQTVMLMNAVLPKLNVIDISERLDLATFEIDDAILNAVGKGISPLTNWPPQAPTEGRGILMAGYPALVRLTKGVVQNVGIIEWGLFTVLGTAGRVSDEQISWMIDRERNVKHPTIPDPPPNAELGGISGGPVISLLERRGVHYWGLSGIISQASAQLERIVAKRADLIAADGKIDRSFA
ncbi:hypothetical protein [Hyphomonas chukchiensis]|uniref:hypothetical protein n=1 Tax=Hyphomonas chukchiensis TaxID=1280947 RepID=UPI0030F533BB